MEEVDYCTQHTKFRLLLKNKMAKSDCYQTCLSLILVLMLSVFHWEIEKAKESKRHDILQEIFLRKNLDCTLNQTIVTGKNPPLPFHEFSQSIKKNSPKHILTS